MFQSTYCSPTTSTLESDTLFWAAFTALMAGDTIEATALIEEKIFNSEAPRASSRRTLQSLRGKKPVTSENRMKSGHLATDSTPSTTGAHHGHQTDAIQAIHASIIDSLDPSPDDLYQLFQREITCLLRLYALETEILTHSGRCCPETIAWFTNRTIRAVNFFNEHASL